MQNLFHSFVGYFFWVSNIQKQSPRGVLSKRRNFAKFAGKHLCQSLFFNKVADLRPATLFKKDTLAPGVLP